MTGRQLTRSALARSRGIAATRPPARIVHIGLGAFHRAHQAWYTARATDSEEWGIAAFAGRGAELAHHLAGQDGLFTLVERGPEGDRFEIVDSIVEAHAGSDAPALLAAVAAASTAVVTLTVTEGGYCLDPTGALDLAHPGVAADLARLRGAVPGPCETTPGRLVAGLRERRRLGAGPLAIVPCDNFPDNGGALRRALIRLAGETDPGLADWISASVSFVSTSVDRITPRVGPELVAEVAATTGWRDVAPVAAEPFADWTLSGAFPAGRPDWESAGARFVDEIEPYEARKLWLLNGAHTLLAALGRLRGHDTVAYAMADPECARAVERWWDEAERQLPDGLGVDAYRAALRERFANPRIEHRLEQIASDALTKLSLRIAPVARAERRSGRTADGAALAIAAWIAAVRRGLAGEDTRDAEIAVAASASDSVTALLRAIDPQLASDAELCGRISSLTGGPELSTAAAEWRLGRS
ncbi:MAG: mannitol dehydrogenase family protein [Microbacterium sp.]|uniref:mannitol dehydrogenase family protein n=1 Tax=Microbacterium sp. TaxID=51671 RepID=UPI0039E40D4E